MANAAKAWPDNVPGDWFVDETCIDCGMCRWVAPATFGDAEDHAFVYRQPADPTRAARAAIACPVGSIGGPAEAVKAAARAFPEEVLPGVYFCGWAQRETFGAASWLLVRPEGNVLVDVPRPNPGLLQRIEELGGVRTLFLTHRDDVHGHEKFAARFGCERVMHAADAGSLTVERRVEGTSPVRFDAELVFIPVPGHTRGSMAMSYRDEVLFSGDHLWGERNGRLSAGRTVCWWSWEEQIRSMERLRDVLFGHVLPGHGQPWHGGEAARRPALEALITRMRA